MFFGDPLGAAPGASVLVGAVEWLEGTLLGTIASTIAIIAVAAVGLGMLWGRVDLRRGATVIAGCFVLFGASNIAAGISLIAEETTVSHEQPLGLPPPLPLPPPEPPAPPEAYDPYAGAAVPLR